MATYQYLQCEKCKHYESYHRYPNPNAVARHYCKKCNDEITYRRASPIAMPIWCGFRRNVISMAILKSQRKANESEKADIILGLDFIRLKINRQK